MLGGHQHAYVIFSLIVAVLGSWTALDLQQQARSYTRKPRFYWLAVTSVAMGASIFSMHFIAMLGFDAGMPIHYDLWLTIASLLLAIGGTAFAFLAVQVRNPSWRRIAFAGLAMGSAICLMHYMGMAAMHVSANISYNEWIVLASFLIAVVVSTSAMIATLKRRSLLIRISGAIVLGLAIFSMHFTAMAAASFEPLANPLLSQNYLDQFSLALWVGTTTMLLLFLALISAMFDRQLEADRVERLRKRLHHASHLNAMGMMASTLAHELNQPLAAAANYLVGAKRLISVQPEDAATLEFGISEAERQIRRAGEIIKRARGLISQTQIRREIVSLEVLVESSIGLCRGNDECHQTEIRVELDPEVDGLMVDPVQTEQVLVNLIRNACGAMKDSPSRRLVISSRPHNREFAQISLSDVGSGFAADPDELFTAFAESTGGGLGVGLSISRTIVEAHGGQIWAENNMGRGATFHFTMPIADPVTLDPAPESGE